jgi:hypothetical protein
MREQGSMRDMRTMRTKRKLSYSVTCVNMFSTSLLRNKREQGGMRNMRNMRKMCKLSYMRKQGCMCQCTMFAYQAKTGLHAKTHKLALIPFGIKAGILRRG